jgi:hypothetical protein
MHAVLCCNATRCSVCPSTIFAPFAEVSSFPVSQDIGNMHDLCAFASEFVSMCVCAGILYGEACNGDNASRELTHIVDVDRDEQVRQMEQRTAQRRQRRR